MTIPDGVRIPGSYLDGLAKSITRRGLRHPLIVRRLDQPISYFPGTSNKWFEIVDGSARWICALVLQLQSVPVIVVKMSDDELTAYRQNPESPNEPVRSAGLLTTHQAAAILKISSSTLTNWRWKGRGPTFVKTRATKRGRVLYRLSDLHVWQRGLTRIVPSQKSLGL